MYVRVGDLTVMSDNCLETHISSLPPDFRKFPLSHHQVSMINSSMAYERVPKNGHIQSVPSAPCPDTLLLFQPSKKWTARHLKIAKVQRTNVQIDGIIDAKYLPTDDDPGKAALQFG